MTSQKWLLLLFLLFLAFGLRIFQLEVQSVWWDEGISLHLASSDFNEIAENRLNNIHPPLYFFGLKAWTAQAGSSVFSARYFSMLAGWLQVAALVALARRWFSFKTAFVAGLLTTISAVSIIYSQEVRVYAFLPLIYIALLALTKELTFPRNREKGGSLTLWLLLGFAVWLGIHLHYISFIVVFYVTLWAVFIFTKTRSWICFKRWFLTLFIVMVFSLPWFLPLSINWQNVNAEANVGTFLSDPVPFPFLIQQVWGFHLSGLAGFLSRNWALTTLTVCAGGVAFLFLVRLLQKNTRKDASQLLLHWLVPLCSALIVWSIRSFSHPRYISIFVPGFLLFAAYLIWPAKSPTSRLLQATINIYSGLLLTGLIAVSIWGLWLYQFNAQVAKDDIRGAARYLVEKAGPDDLILVPDTDWSMTFEFGGETPIEMPQLDDIDGGWSHLSNISMGIERVFVIDYDEGSRDWLDKIPFALSKAGDETRQSEFEGLRVREYQLDQPISPPVMNDVNVNFSQLRLNGAWIEQDAHGGNKLAVALNWDLEETMVDPAHVSLRVLDEDGWLIAKDDSILRDDQGRPTTAWPLGDTTPTYHLIPLPAALPPFAYELVLHVYTLEGDTLKPVDQLDELGNPTGQEIVVGLAHLSSHPIGDETSVETSLPLYPEPIDLAPGLRLLAANIFEDAVTAGSRLNVHLLWQSDKDVDEDLKPAVLLVQDGVILDLNDDHPSFGRYPISLWQPGEMVYERRPLVIPEASEGEASIIVQNGQSEIMIGRIFIEGNDAVFEKPEIEHELDQQFGSIARLRGFEINKDQLSQDENLELTLLWQSTEDKPAGDYVVFTHLLAEDGHLIGQHDSPPALGTRHTTGWLNSEYIIDRHNLSINEGYEGMAKIEVGFYDPKNGERLQLDDGLDFLILPTTIWINDD